MNGTLIVIEGTDGSGKRTQSELLLQYCREQNKAAQLISFPRYQGSFYGELYARFLNGEFGSLEAVDPHLAATIVGLDRMLAKEQLETWLYEGDLVIADRYTPSNMAHQGARVSSDKREEFWQWINQMEYEVNQIPREDVVIFLYVPADHARKLVETKGDRSYLRGKKKDILEEAENHQEQVERVYLELAEKFRHWEKVVCVDSAGHLKSKEDIQAEIRNILRQKNILS